VSYNIHHTLCVFSRRIHSGNLPLKREKFVLWKLTLAKSALIELSSIHRFDVSCCYGDAKRKKTYGR